MLSPPLDSVKATEGQDVIPLMGAGGGQIEVNARQVNQNYDYLRLLSRWDLIVRERSARRGEGGRERERGRDGQRDRERHKEREGERERVRGREKERGERQGGGGEGETARG